MAWRASAASNLPTTEGLDGTAAPAPWSFALVRGGDTLVFGTDGTWASL